MHIVSVLAVDDKLFNSDLIEFAFVDSRHVQIAKTIQGDKEKLFLLNFNGYISKPVDINEPEKFLFKYLVI
ncbi:MAG: hypothetical protein IBX44_08095 [Sulfurospirillum sp.]|nr:hypothetical protein [Sulfurospirillum sp.]